MSIENGKPRRSEGRDRRTLTTKVAGTQRAQNPRTRSVFANHRTYTALFFKKSRHAPTKTQMHLSSA